MRLFVSPAIGRLIDLALDEDDLGFDVTSNVFFEGVDATAQLLAKQDLTLAGLAIVEAVFAKVDPGVSWSFARTDGERVEHGEVFATATGDAASLLRGERTALNFLQRMCGVATMTRRYAEALGDRVRITDTRKTLPGWRELDKYAVAAGGGANHRFSLSGGVMVKDNHIAAAGGIAQAVAAVRRTAPHTLRIEVEVESTQMALEAVDAGADIIMLDNMSTDAMEQTIGAIRKASAHRPVAIEASGNITLERLPELAELDLDYVSSGALTHSVIAADISMKIKE